MASAFGGTRVVIDKKETDKRFLMPPRTDCAGDAQGADGTTAGSPVHESFPGVRDAV